MYFKQEYKITIFEFSIIGVGGRKGRGKTGVRNTTWGDGIQIRSDALDMKVPMDGQKWRYVKEIAGCDDCLDTEMCEKDWP